MSNTSTLDPETEEDQSENTPSDDESGGESSGSQEESGDKNKGRGKRPSLRQARQLGKSFRGTGGAAGEGAASGASATGGAAAAGGGAAGGAAAGGAAAAGGTAAVGGGAAAASFPIWGTVLIVVVVIVLIIVLIVFVFSSGAGALQNKVLTITKSGPSTAALNDPLPYQINVSYPGTAQDIVIQDTIPQGTDYVDSSPNAKFDPATRTATWNLKDFVASQGGILSNPTATLNIKLKATVDKLTIVNQAQGSVIGANAVPSQPAGVPIGDYLPPNDNNCSGKYSLGNRFLPKNFGDPSCNYTKDQAYDLLKQQDPGNADWWFYQVMACESGYNPNAWLDPDNIPHSPDAGGAWGLVQDGSSAILTPDSLYQNYSSRRSVTTSDMTQLPGLAPDIWGHGGEYDRGDVNWQIQIKNAVELLKVRGKGYWACA